MINLLHVQVVFAFWKLSLRFYPPVFSIMLYFNACIFAAFCLLYCMRYTALTLGAGCVALSKGRRRIERVRHVNCQEMSYCCAACWGRGRQMGVAHAEYQWGCMENITARREIQSQGDHYLSVIPQH